MIKLKSKKDINKLAEGGKILSDILDALEKDVCEGIVPTDLDKKAQQLIAEANCVPSFLNYAPGGHKPYPAALCVSINDAVVHGLPGTTPFQNGDVVGIDLGLIYEDKYFLDSARTVAVGNVTEDLQKLIAVTHEALQRGISATKLGNRIGDVSSAIQTYVESEGFEVVRQLVGHGVGYAVHEPPQVPNFGEPGMGEKMKKGLVIAIEPMVTIGDPTVETGEDGWSVEVKTGDKTAHFEHTIAVTKDGPRILT
jgi:methionyl aminopeptidase